MASPSEQKKLVRLVVRQVHPDLFTAHPYERSRNAESLKVTIVANGAVATAQAPRLFSASSGGRSILTMLTSHICILQALNGYADQLSKGRRPQPARLEFYVRGSGGVLSPVTAELPARGSLAPLLLAFGLISIDEAHRDASNDSGTYGETNDGRDLFEWLSGIAADAARAADQHDALKLAVRSLRAEIEGTWGLAAVDVGGEFAVNGNEQQRQLDALGTLQAGLQALAVAEGGAAVVIEGFEGLRMRLYHPDAAPLSSVGCEDSDGTFSLRSEPMNCHVADDGTLHVVADPARVQESLEQLDLGRARLLSRVSSFWVRRCRDLAAALKVGLGVENVWCDTRSDDGGQRFVLWAGAVLERREDVAMALQGRSYSFSLLVHSDEASPLLDFISSSSVLQVRADCPPKHLLAFMSSEAGALAHQAAAQVAGSRAEEEELLAAVRDALGAKHVVRVCSSYDQEKVVQAARRLIEAAPLIRGSVDLTGVSLAIDDCYDVWDSGFVSIPFDFSLVELQPQLQALLHSPDASTESSSGGSRPSAFASSTRASAEGGKDLSGRLSAWSARLSAAKWHGSAGMLRSGWRQRPFLKLPMQRIVLRL